MSARTIDYPIYLFKEGTNCELYKLMKPSYVIDKGVKAWRFRCFAPNAKSISLVGDFNGWDRRVNPMSSIDSGIWECYISGLKRYDSYKFSIENADGRIINKADPFALHTETPPGNASKIYDINGYKWNDSKFLEERKKFDPYSCPINIYEIHLGSWRRHPDGNYYSYRDLADSLIPYVKEMGYTHIELLPVTEHPLEMSWGYQCTGFFAPTSRFGTPHDFMYFVDKCHSEGIYVILDLVFSHFPKDDFGLYRFDGTPLFEYSDPYRAEHKGWGTAVFDYSKGTVQSFLISSACFWMEYYHIDGIRMDAVASMLYLDYDRKEGEWIPNPDGSRYNFDAVSFLRSMNNTLLTKYPGTITIAEESTAFPMVTLPPSIGGLGFNFKWDMGWMNDLLEYISIDPFFRKGSHNKITFGISYAFSENYILPFSHDEVVHGKCSMIGKVPGSYKDKFSALKVLYAYQIAYPGKKLNFMGNEIAQFIEWDFTRPIDWFLLDFETHRGVKAFVKDLNKVYLKNAPLYEQDSCYEGFKWIVVDDNIQNVFVFYRESKQKEKIIVVVHFSDVNRKNYSFGVPDSGKYEVIINTNDREYGGNSSASKEYVTKMVPMHGFQQSVSIDIEGNSAIYLKKSDK